MSDISRFKSRVWKHYRRYGRHDLPWRFTYFTRHSNILKNVGMSRRSKSGVVLDPYKIWVSEVMLQQTQVSRVLKKYPEFLRAFPTVSALSRAPLSKVLNAWQGMGYNRRALYLKRAAGIISKNGFPGTQAELTKLPGIGKNTAGAILAFAYNQPAVFIETNIRRVFIHFFFLAEHSNILENVRMFQRGSSFLKERSSLIRASKRMISDKDILPLIEKTMDRKNPREWYWALMDYGAMLGRTGANPNRRSRHYLRPPTFEGSNRQVRGMILKKLIRGGQKDGDLMKLDPRAKTILKTLESEGFVRRRGARYVVALG